jgi:hypothetical protein
MAIALNPASNLTPGQNNHYLNAWPNLIMEDVWHFNQCAGAGAPLQTANDKSGGVYLQKEREYIARNLESVAGRMAQDLNYWINPAWFSETVWLKNSRPIWNQIFQMRYLKMINLGTRATALIQANVPVVYSDPNNVGVDDTATVTVTTGIANAEIKLYFRVVDGAPTACDYRYEIEPTVVTDATGVATITAHRALFVSPKEWAREYIVNNPNLNSPNVVDTSSTTAFVAFVDVYRVYTAQTANISLYARNNTLLQNYVGEIVDYELSAVRLGDLCESYCFDYAPAYLTVNYYAGSPLVNNNIDSELYEAAVAWACGRMESKLTKMSYWTLDQWVKWHSPMVENVGNNTIPIATKRQSESGYGARAGEVLAWEVVMDRRMEKGIKLF